MGQGGATVKAWCEKEKRSQAQPKKGCLQPSDNHLKKTRASDASNTTPDSWTFSTNLQHEKCQALNHESRHIKNSS